MDERREPVARAGVEALREAENRGAARQRPDDLRERGARHRHDDEVRGLDVRGGDGRHRDAGQVDAGQIPRVVARAGDLLDLRAVAAGERHGVPVVGEQTRERRPPGASAHDHDVHRARPYASRRAFAGPCYDERMKSIETGTPCSSNRARSSFSTQ